MILSSAAERSRNAKSLRIKTVCLGNATYRGDRRRPVIHPEFIESVPEMFLHRAQFLTIVWGRVRKIGTGGEVGAWSDPAQIRVK